MLHGFGQGVGRPNKVFATEIGGLFDGLSVACGALFPLLFPLPPGVVSFALAWRRSSETPKNFKNASGVS